MSHNYQKYGEGAPYPPSDPYPPQQPYPPPQQYPPPQAYPPPPPHGQEHYQNDTPAAPYHTEFSTQQGAPKYEGNPSDYAGKKEERFVPTGKFQDFWAFILFYIHLAGFIVEAAILLPSLDLNELVDVADNVDVTSHAIAVAVGALVSLIATIVYIFLLKAFPLPMIKISFWVSIIIFLGLGALYIVLGIYVAAIVLFVIAVFFLLSYRAFRSRMKLVALLVKTVVDVSNKFVGTYATSVMSLIISFAHSILTVAIAIAGYQRYYDESSESFEAIVFVVWAYALFSFYWTQQVIHNVAHVTLGGVYASFYFLSPAIRAGGSTSANTSEGPGMPKFPVLGSFKRAIGKSFGSVAFGSLVIAAVQFVRAVVQQVMYSSDGPLVFLACCLACFIGCIEGLIEFFNEYAFAQVAIYGKPYCRAAKDTWRLLKTRGIDAIVTENLTGSLITCGCFAIGGLGALGAFLTGLALGLDFFNFSESQTSSGEGTWLIVILLITVFIGFVLFSVAAVVIDSGVTTTLVCLAEEPEALYRTKPELYEAIREAYPKIVVPVRGYV